MLFLYDIGIRLYYFLITIYQHFNPKAKLWLEGRRNLFEKISKEVDSGSACIWFHFASLGEFEQGRPVLERVRDSRPAHKIVVTFFSPSGYELRKNYKKADHIFYLPLDTHKNAKRFVELINPSMAIFTKYEYWYHFFSELNQRNIPLIVISAVFRKSQPFFKWHGVLNRKILHFVTHFFVQDENSKALLATIGVQNVTVSGDTRFDRVAANAEKAEKTEAVEAFCGNSKVFIAGSAWPEDEKIISHLIRKYPDWKFIIAPHEIKREKIDGLIAMLDKVETVRYSSGRDSLTEPQVLIIDNIGMLSSLYQYGLIAYIGGGFGVGIHNTLEAAAFGMPVIFGPNYEKFNEAKELLKIGAGFTVKNQDELEQVMKRLQDEPYRKSVATLAKNYVRQERGATSIIMNYLNSILKS